MAVLTATGLTKTYQVRVLLRKHRITALRDVTVEVPEDSIVAVVGESGSGKSTLARLLLGLENPDTGRVFFHGQDISSFDRTQWKTFRRAVGVIFQDPFASLNPRMSVRSILTEPLKIHGICKGKEALRRATELLRAVELSPEHLSRYPHEFSGGQRQRLCIARALALEPEVLIADEPLSALDVSVQAQIVNLLKRLKAERKLSILLISHDLELVGYLADYVYIMYQAEVVEEGPAVEIFNNPLHPYTKVLLEAAPKITGPRKRPLKKTSPLEPEATNRGCIFLTRCPERMSLCVSEKPSLQNIGTRKIACFKQRHICPG